MSPKSKDAPPLKPTPLAFLLAIAGRLDAQARIWAEALDKNRGIYHAYNILDAANSSFSMFKYFFEVFISNTNDQKILRQIMSSPEGMAAIGAEMAFLVGFSFLASYLDNGKKNKTAVQMFIITNWPRLRELLKGMKNGYKEVKTVVQILNTLGVTDAKSILIPVGLALGVVAAANRLLLLHLRNERRKLLKKNEELLAEFVELSLLSSGVHKAKLRLIHRLSKEKRALAYGSAGFGGLIDGVYLYAGLTTIAILATPVFIAMLAISSFYVVACVLSRLYDEHMEQVKLRISRLRCKLMLVTRELETTYANLLTLQRQLSKDNNELAIAAFLKTDTVRLIERFDHLNRKLGYHAQSSYLRAGMLGVRNGLFGYGVLASLIFTITSIFSLTSAVFPPALLIACICTGLAFMIALTAYYIRAHYQEIQKQERIENKNDPISKLTAVKYRIQADLGLAPKSTEEFAAVLKNATTPAKIAKNDFQEYLEGLRSLFSGASKGYNFVQFADIPFQDVDSQSHAHGISILLMLSVASGALFSIVLALRALTRGLKPEKDEKAAVAKVPKKQVKVAEPGKEPAAQGKQQTAGTPKPKGQGGAGEPGKRTFTLDPHPPSPSLTQRLRFFMTPPTGPRPPIPSPLAPNTHRVSSPCI